MKSCDSCGGAKKILGMGGMKIDCPICRGTGIDHEELADASKKRSKAPVEKSED